MLRLLYAFTRAITLAQSALGQVLLLISYLFSAVTSGGTTTVRGVRSDSSAVHLLFAVGQARSAGQGPANREAGQRLAARTVFALVLTFPLLPLEGSASVSYYLHLAVGHLSMMNAAIPLEDVFATASEEEREALNLVVDARSFAAEQLGLRFNDSYTHYVDLHRNYVVQNLYVAPEFSTTLQNWCYWVIGCASYRGFFNEERLAKERASFQQAGYDTAIFSATAYSTLGWFRDPVLNTFLDQPPYRIVGLIFHEIAHQMLYVKGDTFFNESFAMTVEAVGVERFFENRDPTQIAAFERRRARDRAITDLSLVTRKSLDSLYARPLEREAMREEKASTLAEHSLAFGEITGTADTTFNNASLGAIAAYHKYVPAFREMLVADGADLPAFYARVKVLAELDPQERETRMETWLERAREKAGNAGE